MKYKIETKRYDILVAEDSAIELSSPTLAFDILKEDFDPCSEKMIILILNIRNKIINKIVIAKGGYNAISVTPSDIFRPILLTSGNNFIVAHNHPSGCLDPSEEDLTFTNKIKSASNIVGLNFLDHIIFTSKSWFSFKKGGLL